MMFLCGLDNDGQPVAINIDNCKQITFVSFDDGDLLLVEWGDEQTSRTVQARGATTCGADMLVPVMDLFSQKASKKP